MAMIYVYSCTCGTEAEYDFPFGKPEDVRCDCGKKMYRIIFHPSVTFKGDGFSKDQYTRS